MQVILLERIGRLGQMGDTVTVKDGYARNFLLPQGKALRASEANKQRFEQDRTQLEARNLERKKEAEGVAEKLNGETFIAIRQAGDTGQLYGSVSTRDVATIVTEAGYSIDRTQVQLDAAIKVLGLHPVSVTLHPEVIVSVTVNVARSEEEAKRQARGEDVTAQDDHVEDEDAISVEEVFEDETLSKQAEESLEEDADDADSDSDEASKEDAGDASEDAANDGTDAEEASKED